MAQPQTLHQAVCMAKRHELRLDSVHRARTSQLDRRRVVNNTNFDSPWRTKSAMNRNTSTNSSSSSTQFSQVNARQKTPPVKKLTSMEMQ